MNQIQKKYDIYKSINYNLYKKVDDSIIDSVIIKSFKNSNKSCIKQKLMTKYRINYFS